MGGLPALAAPDHPGPAPVDLTHVQFVLLASAWWLGEGGGRPPSQVAIARHARTSIQMTSEILRKLEARHLLDRTR